MRFASINEDRVSTVNVRRGNIVKIDGFTNPWMVVKRSGRHIKIKSFEGDPIPSRRMGGTNAHERKAYVSDITHVAIS